MVKGELSLTSHYLGSSRFETRLFRLQYLRAVAALCVVLYHVSFYIKLTRGNGAVFSALPDGLGGFGVYLFFAISGYLMATLANKTPPAQFLAHRIIRIYPIYWLLLFLIFTLDGLTGNFFQLNPMAILLMPGATDGYYALGVEWTLPFELTFYLIMFFIIVLRLQQALIPIAITWAIAIVVLAHFAPEVGQDRFATLAGVPFSQWTLPFVLGLFAPLAVRFSYVRWLAIPCALVMLSLTHILTSYGYLLLAGACFFLVVWAAAPRPSNRNRDWLGLLTRFGDWSYALYLCHFPVIRFVVDRSPVHSNPWPTFIIAVTLAILIASILGRIDIALYRRLKWQVDHRGGRLRYALSSIFIATVFTGSGYLTIAAAAERAALATDSTIGNKLAGNAAGASVDVKSNARNLALTEDGRIRANIDEVIRGSGGAGVQIVGWACDPAAPYRQLSVLFFYDGSYRGGTRTKLRRPDVARAFNLYSAFSRTGFIATVPVATPCERSSALIALVRTEDGRYTTIPLSQSAVCDAFGSPK